MRFVKNILLSLFTIGVIFSQDVILSITGYSENSLEISMSNSVPVGGFQFDLDGSFSDFTVEGWNDGFGGSASDAGYTVSTNASGTVLGFSFSGTTIPVSNELIPLVYVEIIFTGDSGTLSISSATSGRRLSIEEIP